MLVFPSLSVMVKRDPLWTRIHSTKSWKLPESGVTKMDERNQIESTFVGGPRGTDPTRGESPLLLLDPFLGSVSLSQSVGDIDCRI